MSTSEQHNKNNNDENLLCTSVHQKDAHGAVTQSVQTIQVGLNKIKKIKGSFIMTSRNEGHQMEGA